METRLFNEISQFCLTCREGDDVWFVSDNFSLIFEMSIKSCRIKRIVRIEGEEFIQFRRYWKLVKFKNKIILVPVNSDKVVVFYVDKDKFSYIYLNKPTTACMSCVKEEHNLYLIDNCEIIVLNMEYETIEEYIAIPFYGKMNSTVALLKSGHLFIPLAFQPVIVDFHISERRFLFCHLECRVNGFIAGVLDGEEILLAGDSGNIIRWDYVSGQCAVYDQLPEGFESFAYDRNGKFITWGKGWREGVGFKYWYECFLVDKKIWFIPLFSNCLLYIDKKDNTIQKYKFEHEEETELTMKEHRCFKFLFIGIYQERYIKIYSVKRDIIYNIDVMSLCYTEEYFDINRLDINDIKEEYFDSLYSKASEENILEKRNISIDELTHVAKRVRKDNKMKLGSGAVGTFIYLNTIR